MRPIHELLNDITWNKKHDPANVEIGYEDRKEQRLIFMPYTRIKRIEQEFMVLDNEEGLEVNIPLHRIREVREKGATLWKRG